MKNIFYFYLLNKIGGIETFFYQLAKKYKDWDITIYYQEGDYKQVKRLSEFVRVKKYNGEHIVCDKAFFNFNIDIIDNVEAKEYIQIIHGDYKALGVLPNQSPKITRYIGVSEIACKSFKELTGKDIELCYNPFAPEKPKKMLHLISATRLTREKGKNRIAKFADMLDREGIPYTWTIFTDDSNSIGNENIVYRHPRLDIIDYIADADYLVQLSDNEGYCYSVVEALSVGTPVIVTDCPVMREIGVNKSNGFILDFDLNNVPIKAIAKGLKKFEYEPKQDRWEEMMAPGKSQYQQDLKSKARIKATKPYWDIEEKRFVQFGEEYETSKARADFIVGNNYAKFVE